MACAVPHEERHAIAARLGQQVAARDVSEGAKGWAYVPEHQAKRAAYDEVHLGRPKWRKESANQSASAKTETTTR